MATAILVNELEQNAIELIKALDKKNFVFTVAALMKNEDEDDWRLVLGVPEIHTKGLRNPLIQINNIIDEKKLDISLSDIKLIDDQDRLFNLLRSKVDSGPKISRLVITGNYFEGIRFPDSIIYVVK
ncbi:MAG TPA: hypothetical protein VIM16_04215 [Mucilaginibacter sp.]|jgi:hypothetical protein